MTRRVILVCGPPGAGKTTYAHTLGLPVYDIDDPTWNGDERLFRAALRQLGNTPDAQAVVIRSGATPRARHRASALIRATETTILDTDPDTCIRRVIDRGRDRPPLDRQIAAVRYWWANYTPGEHVEHPSTPTTPPIARGGYRWTRLKARVFAEETHCWRCGELVDQTLPPNHPRARTVDHVVELWQGGAPLDRGNCRLAHRSCNTAKSNTLRARRPQRETIATPIESI